MKNKHSVMKNKHYEYRLIYTLSIHSDGKMYVECCGMTVEIEEDEPVISGVARALSKAYPYIK